MKKSSLGKIKVKLVKSFVLLEMEENDFFNLQYRKKMV